MISCKLRFLGSVTLFLFLAFVPLRAQEGALMDETVQRLQEYIQVDTINPPGNESRAVEFFARLLEQEGIPYESAESAPGRGIIWARQSGGEKPALILLNHTDVVPANREYWDVDPLSGAIRDGYLYGRGALDMKNMGMMEFQSFVALHRAGRPLNRDVIFVATGDEEAGGFYGAGWMVKNHPEVFTNAGFLLNEGGGAQRSGNQLVMGIEVTQKVPLWLRFKSSGQPGHGSRPLVESAVNRLIEALHRIQNYGFQPHIVPSVEEFFKGISSTREGIRQKQFAQISRSVQEPDFLLQLQIEDPSLHALTRNTCSLTRLQGSSKINVVPPEAEGELDCRLLPDQNPDEFVALLKTIVNDSQIEIEKIMSFTPAVSSTDTELFRAIEAVMKERHPTAVVTPSVSTGFTDSHFFRDLGIACYGFNPAIIPDELDGSVHGNNERVPVESVRQGVADLLKIAERLVY
jgi:acetylornithine deacetylase/succinyl-diaminopimelate desuccinylase-like protein